MSSTVQRKGKHLTTAFRGPRGRLVKDKGGGKFWEQKGKKS